jgi:hypothetical protein
VGHPDVQNGTPFAFEPLFIADEDLRPVVVTVIKATYEFDSDGHVWLADEQLPVNFSGEAWSEGPASSYKYEPEVALCKLTTDICVVGHAYPPNTTTSQMDIGIKVGGVRKIATVFGNRLWVMMNDGVRSASVRTQEPRRNWLRHSVDE